MMGALGIVASGANITTSGTSARVAIPNDAAGVRARFVRVTCTVAAYVKPGNSAITAAAGDILLNPEHELVLAVGGVTHIAAIQVASAGVVNVVPVEDGLR